MRTEILKELTLYICLIHHPPFDPHPPFTTLPTLISTWLKVLPLCMPTTLPIISGTTIMFRRCVLMQAGFSSSGHSFLALRNLLIKARGFLFNPRENLYHHKTQRMHINKAGLDTADKCLCQPTSKAASTFPTMQYHSHALYYLCYSDTMPALYQ